MCTVLGRQALGSLTKCTGSILEMCLKWEVGAQTASQAHALVKAWETAYTFRDQLMLSLKMKTDEPSFHSIIKKWQNNSISGKLIYLRSKCHPSVGKSQEVGAWAWLFINSASCLRQTHTLERAWSFTFQVPRTYFGYKWSLLTMSHIFLLKAETNNEFRVAKQVLHKNVLVKDTKTFFY